LARALDNLLRNAIEASPEGGTISATVQEGGGVGADAVRWCCACRTPDPACPPGRAGELFEPFFTTKPEARGSASRSRARSPVRTRRRGLRSGG